MIVTATKGQWVELPAFRTARVVQKNRSQGTAIAISETAPALSPYDEGQDIYGILVQVGDAVEIDGVQQGSKVYVFASSEDAILSVNEIDSRAFPDGAYSGNRAQNVQFYDESNKKLGAQWEISREIIGATVGQRIFSVMKIGPNSPIDLKARVLGGTDEGVIGKMYWLVDSDIQEFGTPDKWYNFRVDIARTGAQPETLIYPESEVTFAGGLTAVNLAIKARQVSADAYRTTSPVAAAGGLPAAPVGGNRIIYQDEIVMFEIFSKSAQDVTALLEIYEGGLDLPLP